MPEKAKIPGATVFTSLKAFPVRNHRVGQKVSKWHPWARAGLGHQKGHCKRGSVGPRVWGQSSLGRNRGCGTIETLCPDTEN